MADDDLLLDSKDLLDIFGSDDEKGGEDLSKSIEDLFFSDDDEGGTSLSMDGVAEAPALPDEPRPRAALAPAAPEPELAEPDRKGMTEEEWRQSAEYADFKRQVIERHLKKKADEVAAQKAAEEEAVREAERRKEAESAKAAEEAERRKQELVDKYKAAKAATIANRAAAMISEQEQSEQNAAGAEADKEAKFKDYLAGLKAKMAQGGLPQMAMKVPGAPAPSAAAAGMDLTVERCKALAAMFEETREEMLKQVSDKIGKKSAQTMMKKTLAKVAKQHLDIFGRAAVNSKNELREDGALDQERLSRAFYAVPADKRVATLQKAMYELIEMRFIAVELGLGARTKGFVVGKTLDALDRSFKKKGYDPAMLKWYQNDVIPSTALSEGEEDTY
jgi:hypothetical protein